MTDEMLAHRLGLVPLDTDLDRYVLPEKCTCESEFGCNRCRVVLTLDAEAVDSPITVYSGDIHSEDPNSLPVQKGIPLIRLVPGQKVRLEAYARLGQGKKHAKWQPVSVCSYKYLPEIRIDGSRCDACGDCAEVCPKRILTIKDGRLVARNVLDCLMCRDCVQACPEDPPSIEILPDNTSFLFKIESTGALPVKQLVMKASEILVEKTREFGKRLEENTREE